MRIGVVIALAVMLSSFPFGMAENWPQWRGPYLNGISHETNLPLRWGTEKNIQWKLPMPAWSGSTPIIWEERIFLNVADGTNEILNRTVSQRLFKGDTEL